MVCTQYGVDIDKGITTTSHCLASIACTGCTVLLYMCVQSCVCMEYVVVPVFTTTAVVRMEVTVCVLCKYSLPYAHIKFLVKMVSAMSVSIDWYSTKAS